MPTGPPRTVAVPKINIETLIHQHPPPPPRRFTAALNLDTPLTAIGSSVVGPSLVPNRNGIVLVTVPLLLLVWIYRSIPRVKRLVALVRLLVRSSPPSPRPQSQEEEEEGKTPLGTGGLLPNIPLFGNTVG